MWRLHFRREIDPRKGWWIWPSLSGETKDGAQVAIKRLHIENFAYGSREIELVSRLVGKEFRGVIPFIDAGLDAESQHWFVVMEKAEFSLEKFVDERGVQQPDVAARILKDIASGLSEIEMPNKSNCGNSCCSAHRPRIKLGAFFATTSRGSGAKTGKATTAPEIWAAVLAA